MKEKIIGILLIVSMMFYVFAISFSLRTQLDQIQSQLNNVTPAVEVLSQDYLRRAFENGFEFDEGPPFIITPPCDQNLCPNPELDPAPVVGDDY